MGINDCSSDVCSSDLFDRLAGITGCWRRRTKGRLERRLRVRSSPLTLGPARNLSGTRSGIRQSRRVLRRSEEHTSELRSLMRISYAVFCLKKKKKKEHTKKEEEQRQRTRGKHTQQHRRQHIRRENNIPTL